MQNNARARVSLLRLRADTYSRETRKVLHQIFHAPSTCILARTRAHARHALRVRLAFALDIDFRRLYWTISFLSGVLMPVITIISVALVRTLSLYLYTYIYFCLLPERH